MFTGIIEELGKIKRISVRSSVKEAEVKADKILADLNPGDSVAINGVCLTVTGRHSNYFTVEAVKETLKKSNLGKIKCGDKVNLERAVKLEGRLSGHLVLGHVDGLARIAKKQNSNKECYFWLKVNSELLEQIVQQGSVALEGVSLTVAEIKAGLFKVVFVSYTMRETTLSQKRVGDKLNLELDYLGKYVRKYLENRALHLPAGRQESAALDYTD